MQVTHQFDNEYERVLDLESYKIMDSGSEIGFDLLTSLASVVSDTPIAFISFIDSARVWFKSCVGIDEEEVPRFLSACNETITRDDHFVVTGADIESDAPYAKTMKRLGIYFYAGVPILSSSGNNIGTLCVMDYHSRKFNEIQIKKLQLISKQVTKLLEFRSNYQENLKKVSELQEEKYSSDKNFEDLLYRARRKTLVELSAGLSHRLHENLMVIENVSANILSNENISDAIKNELKVLNRGIAGIEVLIRQLDQYINDSIIEESRKYSVTKAVKELLRHMEYKFLEANITCELVQEEELSTFGNVAQFSDSFYAIIQNAIDAVDDLPTRRIEVSIRKNGRKGEIDIMDTGLGIGESVRPFIFQPFFTTKNKINAGIGLSLGKSILEKQGAEISLVKASNPTTFRVTFDIYTD